MLVRKQQYPCRASLSPLCLDVSSWFWDWYLSHVPRKYRKELVHLSLLVQSTVTRFIENVRMRWARTDAAIGEAIVLYVSHVAHVVLSAELDSVFATQNFAARTCAVSTMGSAAEAQFRCARSCFESANSDYLLLLKSSALIVNAVRYVASCFYSRVL